MKTSDSTKEIFSALLNAQSEMGHAKADKFNSHLKAEYATLSALAEVYKEPCAKHKLLVLHSAFSEGDDHFVETRIAHASGEWISTTMKLLLNKRDMQSLGSAITYAKRQQISSLLGIMTEVDDEDVAKTSQKASQSRQVLAAAIDAVKPVRNYASQDTLDLEKLKNPVTGAIAVTKIAQASVEANSKPATAKAESPPPVSSPTPSIVNYAGLKEPDEKWAGWQTKITFGKYTGKTVRDVGFGALKHYMAWMENEAHKNNQQIGIEPRKLRDMLARLNP